MSAIQIGQPKLTFTMSQDPEEFVEYWSKIEELKGGTAYSLHHNCIIAPSATDTKVERAETVLSTVDHLNQINKAFGLAVSDYAKIFNIERSTYYNWINKDMDPKDELIRAKIMELSHLAIEIVKFNKHPYGRLAKTHSYRERTLLSLLQSEVFDSKAIISHCQQLSNMLDARNAATESSKHGGNSVVGTKVGFSS